MSFNYLNLKTGETFQFLIGKVQQNIMEKKKATRIIKFQFLIGKVQRYFYMTFQDEAKDLFQFLIGKVQRKAK